MHVYLWTRKNWLNFGQPLPDPGIFWRILQHCEIGHFSTIWLISLDKLIGSSFFYHKCNLEQGSPHWISEVIQIQSPDSGFRLDSPCGLSLLIVIIIVISCFIVKNQFVPCHARPWALDGIVSYVLPAIASISGVLNRKYFTLEGKVVLLIRWGGHLLC